MEQEPKVKHHLGESTELKGYINGKLNYHETFKKQHVSLASLKHYSHNKNTKKANIQNEVSDSESSIDEMMKKKIHRKAGSLSAKDMKALLGIENESHEINEEENDSITKDSEVSLVSLDDDNSTIDKIISSPPPRPIIDHGSSVKAILTIETEHETVHYI
jgi:predicted  nucleic acid-binding Zn-ribbon protein